MGIGRRRAPALACLVAWLGAASPATAGPPPPRDLIARLEASSAVVVGTFESVTPLAHSAHLGSFRVEQMLGGDEPAREAIDVVWEEPGLSVPARFSRGGRALLGLAPLPTASIWRMRIPDVELRERAVAVADDGRASLARPSLIETDLLAHYLALAPDARAGDAGMTRLAQLAAAAEPGLARSAAVRLTEVHGAAQRPVPREAADAVTRALLRRDAPALASELIAWIERSRPEGLAPALRAAAPSGDDAPIPTALRAALAALEGELDPDLTAELIRSGDEQDRVLACRYARGDLARALLPGLVVSDRSERVRAAAVTRWVEVAGEAALPEALRALEDPAAPVRRAAVEAIAGLGEPALRELVALTGSGRAEAARMAVASMSLMGEPARPALQQLAAEHEDESIRTLARIALGLPIGHVHE